MAIAKNLALERAKVILIGGCDHGKCARSSASFSLRTLARLLSLSWASPMNGTTTPPSSPSTRAALHASNVTPEIDVNSSTCVGGRPGGRSARSARDARSRRRLADPDDAILPLQVGHDLRIDAGPKVVQGARRVLGVVLICGYEKIEIQNGPQIAVKGHGLSPHDQAIDPPGVEEV